MTSRLGRRNRRRIYTPAKQEMPHTAELVACPHCGNTFDSAVKENPYVAAVCQHCSKTVLPEDVDRKNTELAHSIESDLASVRSADSKIAAAHSLEKRTPRILRWLVSFIVSIYVAVISQRVAEKRAHVREVDKKRKRLAKTRLAVDFWRRLTGYPMRWIGTDGKRAGFAPSYHGYDWRCGPIGSEGRGAEAEQRLFSALCRSASDSSSALFGAYVVPGLRIPNAFRRNAHQQATTEIDCLVLTPKGVFVIESKLVRSEVVAPSNHATIYRRASSQAEEAPSDADEWGDGRPHKGWKTGLGEALYQNGHHADCIAALPAPITIGDVYEQVVLVGCERFHGDPSFQNHVSVASYGGEPSFIRAIEDALEQSPAVFDDHQMKKLVEVFAKLRLTSIGLCRKMHHST